MNYNITMVKITEGTTMIILTKQFSVKNIFPICFKFALHLTKEHQISLISLTPKTSK